MQKNNLNKLLYLRDLVVSDTLKEAVERAFGMDFEETQRLCPSEMRRLAEKRAGSPCRLAVPFYDSRTGKWTYDPNHFGNAEEAFDSALNALRVPWYERLYRFFRR
jgi:hypothetical protein